MKDKPVCRTLGTKPRGGKELRRLRKSLIEATQFWPSIINQVESHSVGESLIAGIDALKCPPEAIDAALAKARPAVELWLVRKVRRSLNCFPRRAHKALRDDPQATCDAATARRRAGHGAFFRILGRQVSGDLSQLAHRLTAPEHFLLLLTRNPQDHLYLQIHRVIGTINESILALIFSETEERGQKVAPFDPGLEGDNQSVRDYVRRSSRTLNASCPKNPDTLIPALNAMAISKISMPPTAARCARKRHQQRSARPLPLRTKGQWNRHQSTTAPATTDSKLQLHKAIVDVTSTHTYINLKGCRLSWQQLK